jgi:hypothetical protein
VPSWAIYLDFWFFSAIIFYIMYVRVKTTPNSPRKSVQIVEGIRNGSKVKQKILRHIGIATDEREEQKLKDLANETMAKMLAEREQQSLFPLSENEALSSIKNKKGRTKQKRLEDVLPPSQVYIEDIKETSRIIEGVHEIAGAMFDEMYNGLFKQKKLQERLRDLVITRLAYPCSKHRTREKLSKHFNKEHSLTGLYRVMDLLHPSINLMKQMTFNKMASLFPEQIDLLFFDVTTLYFETVETDDLRKFGYSKDCRFNTTQLVLALATNQDGLPIGYELFSGNTAEVKTLVAAIESWKQLFKINSVCFVGDRAMFCKDNLKLLNDLNYQYIIAAKIRSLPEKIKEEILKEANYHPTIIKKDFGWIGEFAYEKQRLIVSYKTRRAIKDQKDRQRILDKIQKTLGANGKANKLITNSGVKKYTSTDADSIAFLDNNKIEDDAKWDGIHGIITNIAKDENNPAEKLLARYAQLWVIEESFRINKHQLQMRPIFHWKPERIHAHIAICYMAFSLLRHLQYRVNLMQKISIDSILDELLNVQASIYIHKKTGDYYRIPGCFSNNARKIYKTFNLERNLDASIYLE